MQKTVVRSALSQFCTLTVYATPDRLIVVKHFNYKVLNHEYCDIVKFDLDSFRIVADIVPCISEGCSAFVKEKNSCGYVPMEDLVVILKELNL